jgi:hypothetical protein
MFKVMTWNVENLFRPDDPAGPESQSVYETKLEGLAATINAQALTRSASRRSESPKHLST